MQPIYEQMDRADGILFGTPVCLLNVSAQAKIIMDRTYACLWTLGMARKVVAPIVTALEEAGAAARSVVKLAEQLARGKD